MRVHVEVHCKPTTVATYRSVLKRHILPALGGMALSTVGRRELAALHYRLRDRLRTADATVRTVSSMFRRAEAWELVPPDGILRFDQGLGPAGADCWPKLHGRSDDVQSNSGKC